MRIKANPCIEKLSAYQLADLTAPADQQLISLAQNELCFKPSAAVVDSAYRAAINSNKYPDANWSELTNAIAGLHKIKQDRILCGAGSMELLELIGRIFLSSEDSIVMSEYGYSFFKTVAQMYCADIAIAGEIDFTVNVDLVLEQVRPNTKIVFIANPGNPTGTLLDACEIRRLRSELPGHILLVIDEAYAEFTDAANYPAMFDLAEDNNTVILRTFSKIYGLAGMRVGWGYFPAGIYRLVRKVLNPNNISAVSQACAATAMQEQLEMQRRKNQVNLIKADFCRNLKIMGYSIPDSHSNFVLIDFKTEQLASTVYLTLKNQGIILRPMSGYGLPHCLRATISIQQHMDLTVKVLSQCSREPV